MNNVNTRGMADQQSGSVLIIGLILLLVMSISGVYMMNSSIMDERMTANQRSQTNAFLAAEAGLLAAQKELDGKGSDWNKDCAKEDPLIEMTDFDIGASNNDPKNYAKYEVKFKEDCGASGVLLESRGFVYPNTDTGVSRVLTAQYKPISPAGGPGDAPAAISCLGGPCKITPGAGQSRIDGRDHLPGSNGPIDGGKTMPSLYFSDKGEIIEPKGQFKFCGKEQLNEGCSKEGKGADTDLEKFYNPKSYPEVDGKPTHPTAEQFFGKDTPMGGLTSDSKDPGTRDKPTVSLNPTLKGNDSGAGIMIIDGDQIKELKIAGTPSFEGLIVIRNCATLTMNGNSTIYGAIMVDASGCGDDYLPFGQNGTPVVAYSLDALNNAGSLLPSSLGGLSDWQEDINEN